MTEAVGSSPVIGNNVPILICYFLTRKQPCELDFTEIYDNKLFYKKHCRQTSVLITPYSLKLIRICLVMRTQNTHTT